MTDVSQPTTTRTIDVEDPARGTTIGSVPVLDERAVQELAARARMAQPGWAASGFDAPRRGLRPRAPLADGQRRPHARHDLLARPARPTRTRSSRSASPRRASRSGPSTPSSTSPTSGLARSTPLTLGSKVVVRYEPIGLVGVIGPWNYPLVNAFCDCVPALMAGNAVILKPSEVTPLTALLAAEMLERARHARRRLRRRDRRRRDRRRARRRGRLRHVHRLDARPASRSWSAPPRR